MAKWLVEPTYKKSVIEREYYVKSDTNEKLVSETGWRWGSFYVETEDDNPPEIEAGVDIYSCGYESEMIECWDGCWSDFDMDECNEETKEWLETFLEENSAYELEEHGWYHTDTEMIIDCELKIEKVEE